MANDTTKVLTVSHELAQAIVRGERRAIWRLYDDKDLSVNDELLLTDKVDPGSPSTWVRIGTAIIDRVVQKRIGDITEADMEGHRRYRSQEVMLKAFEQHYGNGVTLDTPVKIIHFSFSSHPPVVSESERPKVKHAQIYADGGSRGNPGPSASGYVIYDSQHKELVYRGVYLGVTTNNQAEYTALKLALEDASRFGAQDVEVYMDSLLVVNQMKGIFKVKNRDLWPIHDALKQITQRFRHVTFTHVPRELNRLADAAVNEALDKQLDVHPHTTGAAIVKDKQK